jgi:hypothetical protein
VEDAFGVVLFAVIAVAIVVAVIAAAGSGKLYEQIGRGGLSLNEDEPRPPSSGALAVAERDAEVRQMLTARNERRERQGKAPLDVEDELARLTRPAVDPALEAEIRQLVVARNRRRERQGKPPLDVDDEVARQVRELGTGQH